MITFLRTLSLSVYIACTITTAIVIKEPLSRNIANQHLMVGMFHELQNPYPKASLYLQGILAFREKQYSRALTLLEQTSQWSGTLKIWYLVQIYRQTGKMKEALGILEPLLPQSSDSYIEILIEYLPQLSPSERDFWQQEIRSKHPNLIILYASYLLTQRQFEQAVKWAHAVPNYKQSAEAQLIEGQSNFYLGHLTEAEIALQTAYTLDHTAEHMYWYGRVLLENGKPVQAIPLLEEASNRETAEVVSWYLLALSIAYAKSERCIDAHKTIIEAQARDKSNNNKVRVEIATKELLSLCP